MKKIFLLVILILLVGCTNEVEENKYAYLNYKNNLQNQNDFEETIVDFNTFFDIERINEEVLNYSLIINSPNTNMYDVKALLIHDYTQEEVYPSSGIIDEPIDLLKNTDKKIELKGTILTIDDISNVRFKLFLEYTDDSGQENKIFYQLSRG